MRCLDIIFYKLLVLIHITTQQSQIVQDVCGIRGKLVCPIVDGLGTRVTSGQDSCAEQVPWNVLVENKLSVKDGEIMPYCGGVLITEKHVISAAHCFWLNQNRYGICPPEYVKNDAQTCATRNCPLSCTRMHLKDIKLHLGLTNRFLPDSGIKRDVAKIDIHEVGSDSEVSGFGAIIDSSDGFKSFPVLLQRAEISIRQQQNCRDTWKTSGNQICAFGKSAPTMDTAQAEDLRVADSCNGDSGGGLTQSKLNGREMVVGIISFGEEECGKKGGKPGVYTNIGEEENLMFIRKIINKVDTSSNFGTQTCIASNSKRCVFPFRYKGELFTSCATKYTEDNKPWCSTLTDENRNHVTGEKEWGYCPSSCLADISSLPTADTNSIDFNDLITASKSGDITKVENLLSQGADVNGVEDSNDKKTSLMFASENGHLEVVKKLLEYKADTEAKDVNGTTSLIYAAKAGYKGVAEVLLKNRADANAADIWGDTSLIYALTVRHSDVVKLLIDYGANVNAKDNDGLTCLMHIYYDGFVELVQILIDYKVNVNDKNNEGKTVLDLALSKRQLKLAKLLETNGAKRGSEVK